MTYFVTAICAFCWGLITARVLRLWFDEDFQILKLEGDLIAHRLEDVLASIVELEQRVAGAYDDKKANTNTDVKDNG